MELISVLMTIYNSEKWLKESVTSIINQTYKNIQFIIIDDGSEDNSAGIISSFNDSRIEFYRKEHTGISSSANYGLQFAGGNYIARMDADDISNPERLEVQYKFLKEHENYGIAGSNFIVFNSDNKKFIKVKNPETNEAIKDQMPRRCCIANGTVMMRKEILSLSNGYDKKRKSAEDWDLYLKLINKTKFYNIQEYLVNVREHPGNISRSGLAAKEAEEVLLNYYHQIIENSDNEKRRAKAYFDVGYYYYYSGDWKKSEDYLQKAVELNPSEMRYQRYFLFSKYFSPLVKFLRRTGLFKLFDFFRSIDKNNILFRNRY